MAPDSISMATASGFLSRNGSLVPYRQWSDTVPLPPKESVDVAFVADNPGDWMLHCHVTDHQMAGLMTSFVSFDPYISTQGVFP